MLLIAFEIYDTERDMLPLELTSFEPETILGWSRYFANELRRWTGPNISPADIPATMELICTFYVDGQPYLVRARFHTWESLARLLMKGEI